LRRCPSKTLERLDISDNHISVASKNVIQWLHDNSQVKCLSMAQTEIPAKSIIQLAKILSDTGHRLQKLNIKNCNINSKAMTELCQSLGPNRRLEELTLNGNIVKKKAGKAVCASICANHSLLSLGLRYCSLAKSTLISLLEGLRTKNKSLKKLDIGMNIEISSSEVYNELEDMLTFNTTLHEINLSSIDINGKCVKAIVNGIGKSSSLRIIHLDANKFGKNMKMLAEAVNTNLKIEELTLRRCDISAKDVREFLDALAPSCSLKKLVLKNNDLDQSQFSGKDTKEFPVLIL